MSGFKNLPQQVVIPDATDSVAGLMSAADKTIFDAQNTYRFHAWMSTAGVSISSGIRIPFNNLEANSDGNFNTTTFIYTVANAGFYSFTGFVCPILSTTAGEVDVLLTRFGATAKLFVQDNKVVASAYHGYSFACQVWCALGDQMGVSIGGPAGATLESGQAYCWWAGQLEST
jgi:hypothetical protein